MTDNAALSIAVFRKVTTLLGKLSDEELAALADGSGDLQFVLGGVTVPSTGRRTSTSRTTKAVKPGAEEVAAYLRGLTDQAEAEKYLHDTNLTRDNLLIVAEQLNVSVAKSANKGKIIAALLSGAVGYREKFESVLGGPYRQ
jgi:hypothetical protein